MAKEGRPKKTFKDYKFPDNWQDIVLDMCSEGCSDVEIRAHFITLGGKINVSAWYALEKLNNEFSKTLQIGKVLCQAWWEKQSRINLQNPNFQTGNWYANMKNRFEWRDRTEVDHNLSDNLVEKFNALTNQDLLKAINDFNSRKNKQPE